MGVACPGALLRPPVVSYTAFSPLLCLSAKRFAFCGPVPNVCTLPGVTRHAALWCADFPRVKFTRVHPANLEDLYYTINMLEMGKNVNGSDVVVVEVEVDTGWDYYIG